MKLIACAARLAEVQALSFSYLGHFALFRNPLAESAVGALAGYRQLRAFLRGWLLIARWVHLQYAVEEFLQLRGKSALDSAGGRMTSHAQLVAVRVAKVRAVVVLVILGPQARRTL